jgi:ketosteroid isomerase-like protein
VTTDEAADLAEIQQKIYRYGYAIDARDFESLDALFTEDAIVHYDVPGGVRKPWPEMKGWLPQGLKLFRVTQHNMSNPPVEIEWDPARSRTYGHLLHLQHHKDGSTTRMVHHATYNDEWVRGADGWKIRRRTLSNLYMEGRVYGPDDVELYASPEPY